MEGIRIKNVRSLLDTGEITLKPLNILVGKNSSGKSTFLRCFPLLKQSFFKRANGPILWADSDNYVDFGSYEETINKNDKKDSIEFEFKVEYDEQSIYDNYTFFSNIKNRLMNGNNKKEARVLFDVKQKDEKSEFISNFKICVDNNILEYDFQTNELLYNGLKKSDRNNDKDNMKKEIVFQGNNIITKAYNIIFNNNEIEDLINDINEDNTKSYERNYLRDVIKELCFYPQINNKIDFNGFFVYFNNLIEQTYKKDYEKKMVIEIFEKSKDKLINTTNIEDRLGKIYVLEVLQYCISDIESYFQYINYMKPVRAHAERYYRLYNLSINEIDPDGTNIPMFINSLTEKQLNMLNDWLYKKFEFRVQPSKTPGYVSIKITKGEQEINIVDSGYGYSQILPIVIQLWFLEHNYLSKKLPKQIVIAIEQPELHLHPQMQAQLMDVISEIAEQYKDKIQFIIETHSETMINRIGNLIYKKKLSNDIVNVLLFEKKDENDNTEIKMSCFDEEGYLKNWPIGFFSTEEIK